MCLGTLSALIMRSSSVTSRFAPLTVMALPVGSAIIQYVLSIIMAAVIFFTVGLGFKRIETQAYKHRVYMLQLSTSTYMECSAVC